MKTYRPYSPGQSYLFRRRCGAAPARVTADTGYFSEKNVARAEALGAEPFIATERWKRGEPPPPPPRGRPPADLTPKQCR